MLNLILIEQLRNSVWKFLEDIFGESIPKSWRSKRMQKELLEKEGEEAAYNNVVSEATNKFNKTLKSAGNKFKTLDISPDLKNKLKDKIKLGKQIVDSLVAVAHVEYHSSQHDPSLANMSSIYISLLDYNQDAIEEGRVGGHIFRENSMSKEERFKRWRDWNGRAKPGPDVHTVCDEARQAALARSQSASALRKSPLLSGYRRYTH